MFLGSKTRIFILLLILKIGFCVQLECDTEICPNESRGNGPCNTECMIKSCNYDSLVYQENSLRAFVYGDCLFTCFENKCSRDLLTNTVCDADCDVPECGFDLGACGVCASGCYENMLGDDKCDPECDTLLCRHDVNDCGWCSKGCYKEMLNDGICQEACKTSECNFDSSDCYIECSPGCTMELLYNNYCEEECDTPECNYDNKECRCSEECTQELLSSSVCDPRCNNQECNYQDTVCRECSAGCFYYMIGDGTCDSDCMVSECNYDDYDCGCSPGCFYEENLKEGIEFDYCADECMSIFCDRYEQARQCTDIPKKVRNFYYQMNIKVSYTLSSDKKCTEADSTCSYDIINQAINGICPSSDVCSASECEYLQYYCSLMEECAEGCSKCSSTEICSECEEGRFQLYTDCLTECPSGYEATQLSYMSQLVCIEYPDTSTSTKPKLIFVSVDGKDDATGTPDDPYNSLSLAFLSINAKHSKILLLKGEHDLQIIEQYNGKPVQFSNSPLLNLDQLLTLTITTAFCKDYPDLPNCATERATIQPKNIVTIIANANRFEVKDVNFDGSLLVCSKNCSCSIDSCRYCPLILNPLENFIRVNFRQEDQLLLNDRYETISSNDQIARDCNDFEYFNLIQSIQFNQIYFTNVKFSEFRYGKQSLISVISSDLYLSNVDFYRIVPGKRANNAVIYMESYTYSLNRFEYDTGTVMYLNDGYELISQNSLGGFLITKKVKTIIIRNVAFRYNLTHLGTKQELPQTGYGALIYIEHHKYLLAIEDVVFEYNYNYNGLIFISATDITFTKSDNLQIISKDITIAFNGLTISNCSSKSSLINYISNKNLSIITLDTINIRNSVSLYNKSILSFVNSNLTDEQIYGGYVELIKGSNSYTYLQKRYLQINNLHADTCYFGYAFLELEQIANVEFNNFSIVNSGDTYADLDSNIVNYLTLDYFKDQNLYIQDGFQEDIYLDCLNLIDAFYVYQFEWTSGTISNNTCNRSNGSTAIRFFYGEGDIYIDSVDFYDITTASSQTNAITILDVDSSSVKISNCHFKNIHNGKLGVIYMNQVISAEINSCIFEDVSGNDAGAIAVITGIFIVKNCQFINVKCKNNLGGGIRVLITDDIELDMLISIENSQFNACMTPNGLGCISLESNSYLNTIQVLLNELTFRNCDGLVSAIYVSDNMNMSSGVISNISVLYNYSSIYGAILVRHKQGLLKVINSRFIKNTGFRCGITSNLYSLGELLYIENIEFSENTCSDGVLNLQSSSSGTIVRSNRIRCINNSSGCTDYNQGLFYDSNSIYRNNQHAILIQSGAIVYFDSVDISDNINPIGTAGVLMQGNTYFQCSKCTILNNKGFEGAALRSEQNSQFYISDSIIDGNTSILDASAAYIIGSAYSSTLINTQLTNNTSTQELLIFIQSGNLSIINCTVHDNTSFNNPSILLYRSFIYISNSTFSSQQFYSLSFIDIISESKGFIENCRFFNISFKGLGGAIGVTNSEVSITNSSFEDISSTISGACFYVVDGSRLDITNVKFNRLSSSDSGSLIYISDSSLTIQNVEANEFRFSGIYGYNLLEFFIKNSVFSNGYGIDGGAIYCKLCPSVNIYDTVFQYNSARDSGGAIYLDNYIGKSYHMISGCTFRNNIAGKGGALQAMEASLIIQESYFEKNSAESNGGALALECTIFNNCIYTVANSSFYSNHAEVKGGAIYWDYKMPILQNLTFQENYANYGDEIASYPIKMQYLEYGKPLPYQADSSYTSLSPIAYRITNAIPGQKLSSELRLVLVDHYGSVDYSDFTSSAEISEVDVSTTVLSGTKKIQAVRGEYTINDLSIQFKPGGTTYLEVYSNGIESIKQNYSGDSSSYYDKVYIEVSLRECIAGEYDLGAECKICEAGTYSLDPLIQCSECPSYAKCLGNYTMYPKSGYWRPDKFTDTFYECPNFDACLGSNNYSNFLGECADGYIGNLCQSCDNGYSRTSENECGACPEPSVNAVRLAGILILVIIVCIVMVKTTFKSVYVPTSLYSIYIKIFTNYLQLVVITTQFRLEWPKPVLELFSIQSQSGNIADQIFSVDCYLASESSEANKEIYFQKLIILALIPVILFLISFIIWAIIAQLNKKMSYFKKEMISTNVILFFLVHPTITRGSFSIFACMEIEGKGYYLVDNLDVECWDGKHYLYSLSLAVPCIIVWVLGTPAAVLYYICKHKLELQEIDNKLRFGFLYNGYRTKTFYWEFVILYRKILIICISVFLSTVSINIQALSALLLLIASLYMQMKTRPFTHKTLNIMETRGILAANVTIYCGLFYLTRDLDEPTKYFFLALIVLANFYFISDWLYHLTKTAWRILNKKLGCLRRKYDHQDGYDFDFLKEEPATTQIIPLWGENKCTLLKPSKLHKCKYDLVPYNMNTLYMQHLKMKPQSAYIDSDQLTDKSCDSHSINLELAERFENSSQEAASICNSRSREFDSEGDEEVLDEVNISSLK